ncbi:spore germination protein [Virgibacillus necropolis]|uniref:Spore germination protein n=1 Tax=Virgibacillus necropolis TaxID=163877 RepID=A0A221MG45_9BACI|nr:spore germination protein [Virgibacillus necropolis]ASN06633.1 spore germination protein [Virgibacillus necropolis]
MRKSRHKNKSRSSIFPIKVDELQDLLESKFENNPDLIFTIYEHQQKKVAIFFIAYQVQSDKLEEFLLQPLLNKKEEWTNKSLLNEIPLSTGATKDNLEDILEKLLIGEVFVYPEGEKETVSFLLLKKEKRQLARAETESLVLGPKVAFTESLVTNLNLVRWGIRSTDLVLEEIKVGKITPREVRIVYMKSIANESDVNTMRQRIQDLNVDTIEDNTVLMQYIEDSQITIFPQFYSTELPDRFCYTVTSGKVGVLMEGSPNGFIGPTTLFSFFESTEDIYMRWNAGSFFRILRFVAMVLSVLLTPLYVAAVTYHYELIPTPELITLGQSRAAVPFPPLLEALILEFMIELLREAGARLPTKVGQTMGIVGGIVIGQAAVEAGLTSSILIIVIGISALASFTSPSYLMGTTVRVIRFPMIILAGLFGIIGIMLGICFLIIHLLRITSLGRPYLTPLYPFMWKDFNKALFRLPLNLQSNRAFLLRPKDATRYKRKESTKKKDIDE